MILARGFGFYMPRLRSPADFTGEAGVFEQNETMEGDGEDGSGSGNEDLENDEDEAASEMT